MNDTGGKRSLAQRTMAPKMVARNEGGRAKGKDGGGKKNGWTAAKKIKIKIK